MPLVKQGTVRKYSDALQVVLAQNAKEV